MLQAAISQLDPFRQALATGVVAWALLAALGFVVVRLIRVIQARRQP